MGTNRVKMVLTMLLAAPLLGAGDLLPKAKGEVKPDPVFPFSREIEEFAKADMAGAPVADATLFLGSSSIRLWDIHGSFPGLATINRGFGGATTPDVLLHYKRLKPRLPPRAVVVYVGENDLATGATAEVVAEHILELLRRLRSDYPRARIAWLTIKPSPLRWSLWPQMAAINQRVAQRSAMAGFAVLDVGPVVLAKDGLPDASLFRPDGLHMNPRGYRLWTTRIGAWLREASAGGAASAGP